MQGVCEAQVRVEDMIVKGERFIATLFECVQHLALLTSLQLIDYPAIGRPVHLLQQRHQVLVARVLANLEQRVLRLLVPESLSLRLCEPPHDEADVRLLVRKRLAYGLAIALLVAFIGCLVLLRANVG